MSIIERALGKTISPKAERPPRDAGTAESRSATPLRLAAEGDRVNVDRDRLRREGILPPPNMARQLADEYRRIKRPVLANATGEGAVQTERGNLVLITSSVASEGKTFNTLNLALSITRNPDFSVLLIDGDLPRRHASELLGVSHRPGLTDLLEDEAADPEDYILRTDIDSLSVLPAGHRSDLTPELLGSSRMQALADSLAARGPREIVLFDSAPLLASPDAVSLAGHAGQVIIVVMAAVTRQESVLAAMETLDLAKPVNLILNKAVKVHGGDYYGYYGGYYGSDSSGAG